MAYRVLAELGIIHCVKFRTPWKNVWCSRDRSMTKWPWSEIHHWYSFVLRQRCLGIDIGISTVVPICCQSSSGIGTADNGTTQYRYLYRWYKFWVSVANLLKGTFHSISGDSWWGYLQNLILFIVLNLQHHEKMLVLTGNEHSKVVMMNRSPIWPSQQFVKTFPSNTQDPFYIPFMSFHSLYTLLRVGSSRYIHSMYGSGYYLNVMSLYEVGRRVDMPILYTFL